MSRHKRVGARRVKQNKHLREDSQKFGATVRNLVARRDQAPGICSPLQMDLFDWKSMQQDNNL